LVQLAGHDVRVGGRADRRHRWAVAAVPAGQAELPVALALPGGILEHGEPPHLGCFREVEEELGLAREVGPLLVAAWTAPEGPRPRPIASYIFDGGVLADPGAIRLQKEELDDWRFVPPSEFEAHLPAFMARRVRAAVTARVTGTAVYLPAETPIDG
jgi:8-oxo-dGTP diphosphatase